MSTTNATAWPLRQALNYALRTLILSQAVPAINAYLSAKIQAASASDIPQFTDDAIVTGNIPVPSKPTLCIVGMERVNREQDAVGYYVIPMTTEIRLKTPWVADNAPEDYEFLRAVVEDNLNDLFTALANRTITPTDPETGDPLLPIGFTECRATRSRVLDFDIRAADNVTRYAGWALTHLAYAQYPLNRPGVVGT
jgi:hypothetical protein